MGVRKKSALIKLYYFFGEMSVMTMDEFIRLCKECEITVDGNNGYWQKYPVLSYNASEEAMYAGFYKAEKSYEVAKENVTRMVNKFKELELFRKQNLLRNKLEQIKEDF